MIDLRQRLLFDIQKLIAPEGYCNAGYPNYNTLFGRDSLIVSWQLLSIMPAIAAATLRILARYQAHRTHARRDSEPGKILHEYRFGKAAQQEIPEWSWPYYGSVDSTSLYLIVLEEYVKKTDDGELLEELWPSANAAMRWHLQNAKKSQYGLITYERTNPHGLFHQGWKDSFEDHLGIVPPVAIIEEQGYAYRAAQAFCNLAAHFPGSRKRFLQEVQEFAQRLKESTHAKLWMPWRDYFAAGLDGNGQENRAITSNPGHLLLANDFLDDKTAGLVVKRLFAPDMWTVGGIRTLSSKDSRFDAFSYHLGSVWAHDNWMIYKGLQMRGYYREASLIFESISRAAGVFGGKPPELHAVVESSLGENILPIDYISQLELHNRLEGRHLHSFAANPLQAWAIGGLLNMMDDAAHPSDCIRTDKGVFCGYCRKQMVSLSADTPKDEIEECSECSHLSRRRFPTDS